jgi:hypothetical protein
MSFIIKFFNFSGEWRISQSFSGNLENEIKDHGRKLTLLNYFFGCILISDDFLCYYEKSSWFIERLNWKCFKYKQFKLCQTQKKFKQFREASQWNLIFGIINTDDHSFFFWLWNCSKNPVLSCLRANIHKRRQVASIKVEMTRHGIFILCNNEIQHCFSLWAFTSFSLHFN